MSKSYKTKIIELTEKLKGIPKDSLKLWKNTQNGGVYTLLYDENGKRKRQSLHTKDKQLATRTIAELGCGIAYGDSEHATIIGVHEANLDRALRERTWQDVYEDSIIGTLGESSLKTVSGQWKDKRLDVIRNKQVIKTTAPEIINIFKQLPRSKQGRLITVYNHARDNGWLLNGLVSTNQWRKYRKAIKKSTAAITLEYHQKLLNAVDNRITEHRKACELAGNLEFNSQERFAVGGKTNLCETKHAEFRILLTLLWELGASQSDARELTTDKIDWKTGFIHFQRKKWHRRGVLTERTPIHFPMSDNIKKIIKPLYDTAVKDKTIWLFKELAHQTSEEIARMMGEYKKLAGIPAKVICQDGLKKKITLHSYRYRLAQHCLEIGATEREAKLVLGHNSQMVHDAYVRGGEMSIQPLDKIAEERSSKIIKMPVAA